MARLLSLFMIFALVATQGTAMASALCRHRNAEAHILARESRDAAVATVALGEEAAAATASKKASQSADTSSHWPAEFLPADVEAPRPRVAERPTFRPAPEATLPSTTPLPLLRPPSA
jgi:hypothetical protein